MLFVKFTDTSKVEIKLFTSKITFNAMELFYICVGIGAASWRAEFCYEVKYINHRTCSRSIYANFGVTR